MLNTIYGLAHMILRDECPPDQRAYLCMHGEEDEARCQECWSNYLRYVVNGCKGHPYEYDVELQKELEARYITSEHISDVY